MARSIRSWPSLFGFADAQGATVEPRRVWASTVVSAHRKQMDDASLKGGKADLHRDCNFVSTSAKNCRMLSRLRGART